MGEWEKIEIGLKLVGDGWLGRQFRSDVEIYFRIDQSLNKKHESEKII